MNSDDASGLPLSGDVEYEGVLNPEPIRGEAEVRDHIQQIAPFMDVSQKMVLIDGDSAAILADFESVNGIHSKGAFFLEVTSGKISRIRTVLDTRPLFAGSKGN